MDAVGWAVLALIGAATVTLIALAPRLKRDHLRKQLDGAAGGSLAGLGSGFDAVWRPSAEDAHAQWEAQVEMPAPAPTPGDKGSVDEGRLIIEVDQPKRSGL
jgi:hypothetical protein